MLQRLFASIPYEWYPSNTIARYEGYNASVVYSFFAEACFEMVAEDYTSTWRIDLTLIVGNKCYVMEFKVEELGKLKCTCASETERLS